MSFFSLFIFGLTLNLNPEVDPPVIELPATAVYTPMGFDDNDVAQFVVEGVFPDPCHRVKEIRQEYFDPNIISFRLFVYRYEEFCPEVMTPFYETIDAGILEVGEYEIWNDLENRLTKKPMGELKISEAVSNKRDEFVYAPVDSAVIYYIRNDEGEVKARYLTLFGNFPSECLDFRTPPKVSKTNKNTIEVLPIINIDSTKNCRASKRDFKKVVELPSSIPEGRYLLHVRTMAGSSFNKIIELEGLD